MKSKGRERQRRLCCFGRSVKIVTVGRQILASLAIYIRPNL
jgi:hypothetical protein